MTVMMIVRVIVVMLSLTMIVMRMIVMLVVVIVAGVLVTGMIFVIVTMMAVILVPMRRMTTAGIGAALRIERRFDGDDARAEATHHLLDDVIAPDAQALADDLGRQMTIAEMPRDPHQMLRIGAADFHQRLGCCDHFDQPAVFEYQRIAAAQRDGLFQVQQEFQPARAGHRHAPPVPVVEIEHHRIGGTRPASRRVNLRRADHDGRLIVSALPRR